MASGANTHSEELIQELLVIQDEVRISDVVDDGPYLDLGQLLGIVGQPAADHHEVVEGHLNLIGQGLHLDYKERLVGENRGLVIRYLILLT